VRKSGDRVRITAQLIKAADGFHVWSDTFTRELKDIFAVQDEIAGVIAKNLSLKLGVTSAASTTPVNPQAFELYVQARQAWNLRTAEGFMQAEQLLASALELQPNFARATAAQAGVVLTRDVGNSTIGGFNQRPAESLRWALAKVEQALALDPDSAEAYATRGFGRIIAWQFADAQADLRRAVALNPNYALAHHWLGDALVNDGQMDEALAELRLATQLDPLSHRTAERYARALLDAGRAAEALTVIGAALRVQPNSSVTLSKAEALLRLGRIPEAVAVANLPIAPSAIVLSPVVILARAGRTAEAAAAFTGMKPDDPNTFFALAALGRREEALASLERNGLPVLMFSVFCFAPEYDALRTDSRVIDFLARTGMTGAHVRAQTWRAKHPPATTP